MLASLLLPILVSSLGEAPGPNPWIPWGQEALARAKREGKPVLVLVGDSLCNACREGEAALMADGEAMALLAKGVVGVRVDRFDRSDLDDFFATAAFVLGAERDYPLALLLTPQGHPFAALGGVHRREEPDGPGVAAFAQRGIDEYGRHRTQVESLAAATLETLRRGQRAEKPMGTLSADIVKRAVKGAMETLGPTLDRTHDPSAVHASLFLLLEEHWRTGDRGLLHTAEGLLDRLATRGEPRNLYDVALLLEAQTAAHAATGRAIYRERAASLVRLALEELKDPRGGFRASRALGASPADERVFTGWNGLMIGALAAAGRQTGRKDDVDLAREAAKGILDRLGPPEGLKRYARGDETHGSAILEDFALLAEGLLDLHDADSDEPRWLKQAVSLVQLAMNRFLDPTAGGFFGGEATPEILPVRIKSGYDDLLPSGNGVMALVLLRLSRATGEARYEALARQTVDAFLGDLQRTPRGMETLAVAAGRLLDRETAPEAPSRPPRSREVLGPVSVELVASRHRVTLGEAFEARVELAIAPGWQVVAHEVKAKDLAPLTVSIPGSDASVRPLRYPAPTRTRDPRGVAPFPVLEGRATVAVPLRFSESVSSGQKRLAVRVVFQACDATSCRPPDSAFLEILLTVDPRR